MFRLSTLASLLFFTATSALAGYVVQVPLGPSANASANADGYLLVGFEFPGNGQPFKTWGRVSNCPADAALAPFATPTVSAVPTIVRRSDYFPGDPIVSHRYAPTSNPGLYWDNSDLPYSAPSLHGQARFCIQASEAEAVAAGLNASGDINYGSASVAQGVSTSGPLAYDPSNVLVHSLSLGESSNGVEGVRIQIGTRAYFLYWARLFPYTNVSTDWQVNGYSYNHFVGLADVTTQANISVTGGYRSDFTSEAGTVTVQINSQAFPLNTDPVPEPPPFGGEI